MNEIKKKTIKNNQLIKPLISPVINILKCKLSKLEKEIKMKCVNNTQNTNNSL